METCATLEEQLSEWVEGRNKHVVVGSVHQCCPDFSCCRPDLAQPLEVRRAFVAAEEEVRNDLLVAFLMGMMTNNRPEVSLSEDGVVVEEPS